MRLLMHHSNLQINVDCPPTFPSWQPVRGIDHILTSPSLRIERLRAVDFWCSDHLPLNLDIRLPVSLQLRSAAGAGAHGRRPARVGVQTVAR